MEEKILCNICNLDDSKLLFAKDGISIVRCNRCGLVYVNPRLKTDLLHNQYHQSDYFDYYQAMEKSDRKTFANRLEKIEKLVKPSRLLDLGCARGVFLEVAESRGWQAVGVDISTAAVQHCQDRGLSVYCGNLPDLRLEAGSFDFVNMEDSIEHMPDPQEIITEVHRLLKPGGWLLVRTPDIGSPLARVLGKRWIQIKPGEHIYYFSAGTLKKLLEPCGFTVSSAESLGRVFFLELIAEKSKHHNHFFGALLMNIINLLGINQKTISLNLGDEIGVWAKKGGRE